MCLLGAVSLWSIVLGSVVVILALTDQMENGWIGALLIVVGLIAGKIFMRLDSPH